MASVRFLALGCALAFSFLILGERTARGVTPESPEVKALVEKALTYLSTTTHDKIGGKCLIALAFKKNGRDKKHPKIQEAIDGCLSAKFSSFFEADNYNLGLMIIFLCEMEDEAYKPTIQRMLAELLKRQQAKGGWGYEGSSTGDTSQTQYAVLAMWIADRHGMNVPVQNIAAVMNWLIRTQDRTGAWGYQGNDPGGGQRVDQSPHSMSLASAACGSLYIMQSIVVVPGEINPVGTNQVKLPGALEVVETKRPGQDLPRRPITGVDGGQLRKAQVDGGNWLQKNFTTKPPEWEHYAFYAYERYASFKEAAEKNEEEEPQWYNDIYKRLASSINTDGHWESSDAASVNTAFGVLVLSRSTKKAIKRVEEVLGEGIMLGGMGLPPTTIDIVERNGKLVGATKGAGNIDNLLSLIGDDDNPDLIRAIEDKDTFIKLDADITKRTSQISLLRSKVTSGSPEARLLAVRSLGKDRNLDNVPVLLFALGSEDLRIVYAADRGLRFISRKFDGVLKWEVADAATKLALRKAWREWYLSIKPDAELLD